MYIGTILHYDSLLSNVLKNAEYETRTYQALISEADNKELWEQWEAIYTNLFDEKHKENAETFYKAHEAEMLEGTQVLWLEKWSYVELMKMRITEGIAAFNSEMQNNPIDPENADFNEEWFDFYDDGPLPDFSKSNFVIVGANDPSLGKNQKADTSSIIDVALDLNTGYMYVCGASVEKRKPDVIIDDVIETHRRYKRDLNKGYYKFGVETVQFQYFFKNVMAAKALETGEYIPIEEIQSSVNKVVRIRSLQPFIKNKWLKFRHKDKELLRQLTEFPMGKNDDAPDGLQMAVALAQQVREIAIQTEYKSILKRRTRFRKGAW
jgi:predicted phage terminase large subunit-like protein